MGVEVFTGELDKPQVEEFTGKLDQPAPSQGFTAAQLGLDPKIYGPDYRGFPSTQNVGPPLPEFPNQLTADLSINGGGQVLTPEQSSRAAMQEVAQNVAPGDQAIPFAQSEQKQNAAIPAVVAGLTQLAIPIPGSGWGALALQSLASGLGGASGELLRQQREREPTNPTQIAKVGGTTAAGNFAGGALFKTLGMASKAIFSTPLNPEQQQAANFAREQGLKFPLSSAAPGTAAGNVQQGTRTFLAGDIKTQLDANKVTTYLNNTVGRMTEKANVFDDAARQGQEFLRQVFEPGETAYKNAFGNYAEAVGADTPIPTANTLAAVQKAADMLENRGQTTGGLYQRLRTILKRAPETYTAREFDELYGSVIKQAFTSKAAAGGEGKLVLSGIVQDMDAVGQATGGVNFADDIAKASAIREQFRELRNVPQLERLATEIGDRGGTRGTIDWMNSLFSSGNGKALAKLRELNPTLYHDLADAWLARQIDNAAGYSKGGIARTVDGEALRSWFEQNQDKIREIFGAPQAQALDNFSIYAKYMTGAVKRSAEGKTFDMLNLLPRAGAEAGALALKPAVIVSGEPAAFLLARGLADPNSALFKAFTEGFSPATRSFAIKAGGLVGQQGARAVNGKEQR